MPQPFELVDTLERANPADIAFLDAQRQWHDVARPDQILPLEDWYTTLAMAGRGWGKTRVGAEWVFRQGGLHPGVVIHIIAPTYSDLRGVVFEGPSGLTSVIPRACIRSLTYSPYPEMVLWNGTIIRGFSSETPDRLRGPQATFVWGDELAAWYRAEEALSNIDFSTRIAYRKPDGSLVQPQKLYTTTPRPLQFLVEMIEKKLPDGRDATYMIRGSTLDNRDNLAENFFTDLMQYEGTQIGRQEIYGELLDISESAIIKRSWLKVWPKTKEMPWLDFVIVSMDTAFTEKTYDKKTFSSDPTACTVWGAFQHQKKWNLLLLNCWEDWLSFPDLVARTQKEMSLIYGRRSKTYFQPLYGKSYAQDQIKKPDLLVIEDKGSGISLRQQLQREGVDSFPYNPGRADKLSRLHNVSHLALHGRIWLMESDKPERAGKPKDWAEPMLKQLCTYSGPGTTPHDDWIDSCCTYTANILMADESLCPIDQIKAGDCVMTPLGPRRVLQAGQTGVKAVWRLQWQGLRLEATGNHPVWTSRGWTRLDQLTQQSILTSWHGKQNPALLSSPNIFRDVSTIDTQTPSRLNIANIFRVLESSFIVPYGSIIEGLFRKAIRFITRMTILRTIEFGILSASHASVMTTCTEQRISSGGVARSSLPILPKRVRLPRNGTLLQRVGRGIRSTLTKASSATKRLHVEPLGTVEPVYNLRVEEAECYYANGILVHNCSQAWRVFGDRFVSEGVMRRIDDNDPNARITVPVNNPEFEYSYDVESGYVLPETVRAPYD